MNDCIDHQRAADKQGYGKVKRRLNGETKWYRAHRLAWEEAHGPIPDEMVVLHSCDNPRCVNVEHLSIGTIADNNLDKVNKGRQARGFALPFTKLSDNDVRNIVARRRNGEPSPSIAERYGVSSGYVRQIACGHRRARSAPPTEIFGEANQPSTESTEP